MNNGRLYIQFACLELQCMIYIFYVTCVSLVSHTRKSRNAQSAWFVKVLEFEKSLNLGETETGKTGVKYIRPAV